MMRWIFFALALGAAAVALHVHPARIQRVIHRTLHATGQLGVRMAIVTLLLLVFLAEEFGLDIALGAFVAGLVVGLVLPRGHDPVRVSLEGIGYGLFVPVFFITSGITFDLDALLSDWSTAALVSAVKRSLVDVKMVAAGCGCTSCRGLR